MALVRSKCRLRGNVTRLLEREADGERLWKYRDKAVAASSRKLRSGYVPKIWSGAAIRPHAKASKVSAWWNTSSSCRTTLCVGTLLAWRYLFNNVFVGSTMTSTSVVGFRIPR